MIDQKVNTELIQLLSALARDHRQTAIDSASRLTKLLRHTDIPCTVAMRSLNRWPALHAPTDGPTTTGFVDQYSFTIGHFSPEEEAEFDVDLSPLKKMKDPPKPKDEPDASLEPPA